MRDILRRALASTLATLRIAPRSTGWIILLGAFAIFPIGLIYHFRGGDEALLEAWENFYSLVIVFGIAFLVFLYHLWLAPYKILSEKNKRTNERIDGLANVQDASRVVDEEAVMRSQLIRRKPSHLRR